MTKKLIVVLALLSSLAVAGGCSSGGSSLNSSGDNGSIAPLQTGSGTATLAWDATTTNVDGSPLTDLAGYKIHVGTASGAYMATVDVGNITTYSLNKLGAGQYYFVVTAYTSNGVESDYSNEVSKTI